MYKIMWKRAWSAVRQARGANGLPSFPLRYAAMYAYVSRGGAA